MDHHLDASQMQYEWNNAIPPRLEIDAGDTVVLETRDAADRYYSRTSTHSDVLARGPFRGHPLTGPVRVRGARPGDALVVEILEVKPADFGWTAIRPGRGLLPEAEFAKPYLQIWDLSDGTHARAGDRIAVPMDPFPGVIGTALDLPGGHSTMPPRKNGGNMDIKQLTAGTTLYLPIAVDGALFSAGDGHAAQGDGEVCITAIETTMTATLRFGLERDHALDGPEFETTGPLSPRTNGGHHYVTTGIAPDLMEASREAIRAMIRHLVAKRGLTREEAYVLSSVAVDLKISEVVDAPNWVVSAFLPLAIFGD